MSEELLNQEITTSDAVAAIKSILRWYDVYVQQGNIVTPAEERLRFAINEQLKSYELMLEYATAAQAAQDMIAGVEDAPAEETHETSEKE